LVDKVLFANVKDRDDMEEKAFYSKRGIPRKPEFESDDKTADKAGPIASTNDEIEFFFEPDEEAVSQHKLPRLERPHIRVSGRVRIIQLKKYLLGQLGKPEKVLRRIELKCRNEIVGNDHSLRFTQRTIWMTSEPMKLVYHLSDDNTLYFAKCLLPGLH
jgi:hypothetical protein